MLDGMSTLQTSEKPGKQSELTKRQVDLFVRMLEKYLAWVEKVPDIAEEKQK